MDENDDIDASYEEAKMIVWNALKPDVTIDANFLNRVQSPLTHIPTIDYSSKEITEQAIQDCKTPHELDLLMGDIAKHNLVPQYLEKKKSLK